MPTTPSPAQIRSRAPGTAAGHLAPPPPPARPASPSTASATACGANLSLLPDEDPREFHEHEAMWLAVWSPRDLFEQEAALVH